MSNLGASTSSLNITAPSASSTDRRCESTRYLERSEEVQGKFTSLTFDHESRPSELGSEVGSCSRMRHEERSGGETHGPARGGERVKNARLASKLFRPISRLMNTIKLCAQFVCFLSIVPTNITCQTASNSNHLRYQVQVQSHPQQQSLGTPQLLLEQQQDSDWAKRLIKKPNSQQLMQRVQTQIGAEQRQEEQLSLRPARQRLLSEFVSNKSSKLLKNLVNGTIADLVAQTSARTSNQNKSPAPQTSPLFGANGGGGSGQILQSTHMNTRIFPTMGRLYTLLFPKAPSLADQPQVRANLIVGANRTLAAESKLGRPASVQSEEVYSANGEPLASLGQEMSHEKQYINLSAPYESQPRVSMKSLHRLQGSGQTLVPRHHIGSEINGPRNRPGSEDKQDGQSGVYQQQHGETPSLAEEPEESGLVAPVAEIGAENQDHYESVDGLLLGANETSAVGSETDGSSGGGQELQSTGEQQVGPIQQVTDNELHYEHEQPNFEMYKMQKDNEQGQENESVPANQAMMGQMTEQELSQDQHREQHQEQAGEEGVFSQVQPNEELAHVSQDSPQNQAEFVTYVREESPGENVSISSADSADELSTQPTIKGQIPNETQPTASDESFLTAQLPSQYDAVIRMPPEGYYDDYFKPMSSSASLHSDPSSLSNSQDGISVLSADNAPMSQAQVSQQNENLDTEEPTNSTQVQSNPDPKQPANDQYSLPKQYFLSQRPSRQNETHADQNVKFIAANRSEMNEMRAQPNFNYDLPSVFDNEYEHQHKVMLVTGSSRNHPVNASNYRGLEFKTPQAQYQANNQSEDAIQLIIANTNSDSRDPTNNEKVINYTSEGRNITHFGGKSPRNTFINKEMNEFPPSGNYNTQEDGSQMEQAQKTPSPETSKQQPDDELAFDGHQNRKQVVVRKRPEQEEPGINLGPEGSVGQPVDELQRVNTVEHSYGRDRDQLEADSRHVGLPKKHSFVPESRDDRQESLARTNDKDAHRNRKQGENDRRTNRRARHQAKLNTNQQTIRRPQLTQVNFNPKDLIMNPPTPLPVVSGSTISSIVELPTKMKRLRDNQPDKNELMNELLTALDRVKVAIYKLQPLTAKMNAIYRKSVTSNTRDIIMDNHKGTYAKRYPPGDYDDTYDRMHPSELLERQVAPSKRSTRSKGSSSSMVASGSAANAVYLPAPKEMLAKSNQTNRTDSSESRHLFTVDNLNLGESQIVATGIGRRFGDGRITGRLSFTGGQRAGNDDDESGDYDDDARRPSLVANSSSSSRRNRRAFDSAAPSFVPTESLEDSNVQSPLFGYRITIYQSPDGGEDSEIGEQRLDGTENGDFGERLEEAREIPISFTNMDDDSMATSESSIVELQPEAIEPRANETGEHLDGSESKSEKKFESWKKGKKSGQEQEKKKAFAKGQEEKGKSKKSQSRRKKDEEESKKKKEYKKIKHNKGIVSKEKKSMKRDKHVKAHDRGAAKEKALKERTQIEFFEREQIVDDEFEKGKKSTAKAGWQTGYDSKKSKEALGDTLSMGGSHFVKHEPKDAYSEKGIQHASETSSAKKSNNYEKKQMDQKGKKFKGWREKGYKIITETEFIDRGSLHDSAYKKRDKGAAHHQKYKKQEASSEGHHGSMQEHHKKSQKKEEKKSKMNEKREKQLKKGDEEKREKRKKEKEAGEKKKKGYDHDHDGSSVSATVGPTEDRYPEGGEDSVEAEDSMQNLSKHQRSNQPMLISATSAAFPPAQLPKQSDRRAQQQSASLMRLLNANHDEEPKFASREDSATGLTRSDNSTQAAPPDTRSPQTILPKFQPTNESNLDSNRRSDGPAYAQTTAKPATAQDRNGSTILDIVDNLTGRQINKTRIGTYELEDQLSSRPTNNNSTPLLQISNGLAKLFPALSQSALPIRNTVTTPASSTTTSRPHNGSQPLKNQSRESVDEALLLSLLHQANRQQQQQIFGNKFEKPKDTTRMMDEASFLSWNKGNKLGPRLDQTPSSRAFDQADAIAQALQSVQRVEPLSQSIRNPFEILGLKNALQHQTFLQPSISATTYQQRPSYYPPVQLSYPAGPMAFDGDQFLEYEQDVGLSQRQNNFLVN